MAKLRLNNYTKKSRAKSKNESPQVDISTMTWERLRSFSQSGYFMNLYLYGFRTLSGVLKTVVFERRGYIYIYIHTYITYIHYITLHCIALHYITIQYHTYIQTYIHTYKHTKIQTYKHTNIHTYIHTSIHTYIHRYIDT